MNNAQDGRFYKKANMATTKKKTAKRTAKTQAPTAKKSVSQVMAELKKCGNEKTRQIFQRHGARNLFGVSVADMKVIAKSIKGQQELARQLYATGHDDAMYLAGIVADGALMSKKELDQWAKQAGWYMVAEYTAAWVAIENPHGRDMAIKWIGSKKESIASTGWATYAGLASYYPDEQLDLPEIQGLLETVKNEIHQQPNRVRYTMNGFVIAIGGCVKPLLKQAKQVAAKIGKVEVEMGDTACRVPLATEYIAKIEKAGRIGKKRANIKC